jgi:glucosamine--fructose-6-phosphate aminotransferase (isomerizing)
MCGIIGYVGKQNAVPLLIEGLRRLEYRGYDSAGIAFLQSSRLEVKRTVGKLANLESAIAGQDYRSHIGIGHTRWATHGRPSEENAHPHRVGSLVLVHNGIIENYLTLKRELLAEGRTFSSETDTEAILHLMDKAVERGCGLEEAVYAALSRIKGSYAFVAMHGQEPNTLVAARQGCPLVAGITPEGYFVASDVPAILNQTREVLFLDDGEVVVLTPQMIRVTDFEGRHREKTHAHISWSPLVAEKGGYKHFMLKEIHEQPQAILDTLLGRVSQETGEIYLEEVPLGESDLGPLRKIFLIACGTSWHAALVGKYLIEDLARVPVEVDIASEFRYRNPILGPRDLCILISQSGETADTLAALRESKSKQACSIAICNVVGSTLSREADGTVYTHSGPEIGVAATKTFTAQLVALYLLGMFLGRRNGCLPSDRALTLIHNLLHVPKLVEQVLKDEEKVHELAKRYFKYRDFLFLGRGINYPIALEGALKLKELSYIHAEGYPAGEMKHGPIALIDENMPVVVLAPVDKVYEKMASNIMEVRARDGVVLAMTTQGNQEIASKADEVIYIPQADPLLVPLLLTIPLQLLAYHIAVLRGCDVDQPRNLAKSVTVE